MAQLILSCLNTYFHHAAKRCIVPVNAPSVSNPIGWLVANPIGWIADDARLSV
jgi:hypothetical protein